MLTLTTEGAAAVREILASEPDLSTEAGLRISAEPHGDHVHLGIDLVDAPEAGDHVIDDAGARVYVAEGLMEDFEGVALHAEEDDEGLSFTFVELAGE